MLWIHFCAKRRYPFVQIFSHQQLSSAHATVCVEQAHEARGVGDRAIEFVKIFVGCVSCGADSVVRAIGSQLHHSKARPTRRRDLAAENVGIEKLRRGERCRFRNGFQVHNRMG